MCNNELLLRHQSEQPLLVRAADVIPLVYLRAVGRRDARHVEHLAAVARHDLVVPAAHLDDLPLLRSRAVLVPLP